MFIGTYSHSIDAKGRIIVPAKFREALGEDFVVTMGLDGCLFVFARPEWGELEDKAIKLPMTDPAARKFSRYILGNACECDMDRQGRILLPQHLRDAAGLTKEAVLVGVGSKIEIWDREKWDGAISYDDMDEIATHMEGLGI